MMLTVEHWQTTLYKSVLWSVLILVYIKRLVTNAKTLDSEHLETPVCFGTLLWTKGLNISRCEGFSAQLKKSLTGFNESKLVLVYD